MPQETVNLLVIAVMKSYAAKFHVKKITVGTQGGTLEFSSLSVLGDRRLSAAMEVPLYGRRRKNYDFYGEIFEIRGNFYLIFTKITCLKLRNAL